MFFNFSKFIKLFFLIFTFIVIFPSCERALEETTKELADADKTHKTPTTTPEEEASIPNSDKNYYYCVCNPNRANDREHIQATSITEAQEEMIQRCKKKGEDEIILIPTCTEGLNMSKHPRFWNK